MEQQRYIHCLTRIVGADDDGEPVKVWKVQLCDERGKDHILARGRDNDDRLFHLLVDGDGEPTIGDEV